jgi:hypothetical protein
MAQGVAISDRPRPWADNEERFPSTHWLTMGLGGRIPPLLEAFPRTLLALGNRLRLHAEHHDPAVLAAEGFGGIG